MCKYKIVKNTKLNTQNIFTQSWDRTDTKGLNKVTRDR